MFTIVDERNPGGDLPRFTADDLTKIPFVNTDSINVLAMTKKVDDMEQRMKVIESLLMQSSQPSMICDVSGAANTSDGTTINTGMLLVRIPRILWTRITTTIQPQPNSSHLTLMLMKVNRGRPWLVAIVHRKSASLSNHQLRQRQNRRKENYSELFLVTRT